MRLFFLKRRHGPRMQMRAYLRPFYLPSSELLGGPRIIRDFIAQKVCGRNVIPLTEILEAVQCEDVLDGSRSRAIPLVVGLRIDSYDETHQTTVALLRDFRIRGCMICILDNKLFYGTNFFSFERGVSSDWRDSGVRGPGDWPSDR